VTDTVYHVDVVKPTLSWIVLISVVGVALAGSVNSEAAPVDVIPAVGARPWGIALNPAGTYAYVALSGAALPEAGGLAKVNLATNQVTQILSLPSRARGISIDPSGSYAYVMSPGPGTISKVDLATDALSATISVGGSVSSRNPMNMAITPDGNFGYVTNSANGTVAKVDLHTNSVITAIPVGSSPLGIAINAAATFAYSTGQPLTKINLASGATTPIYLPNAATGRDIALSPGGAYGYVTDLQNSGHVFKVNLATGATEATIAVAARPSQIAVDPAGEHAYVTHDSLGLTSVVTKLNLATNSVMATIPVTSAGEGIALNSAATFAYVTQPGTYEATGESLAKIDLAPTPSASLTSEAAVVPVGTPLTFDASASSALWGEVISSYEWDFDGDGTFETAGTATLAHTFGSTGAKAVAVRITAPTGISTSGVTVTVVPDSVDARIAAAQPSVLAGAPVRFSAESSTALSGVIASYEWDLDGNGTFETPGSASVSRQFDTIGDHEVGVRVTSRGGTQATASTSVRVTIAPPPGEVGVSINDGAQFTHDPDVNVSIVWPASASGVRLANDGGFRAAEGRALSPSVPWKLASSGPERLPKTVYVRFSGTDDGTRTFTDDIILDETAPVISSAAVTQSATARFAAKSRTYRVTVKASDKTSGVAKAQVATDKRKRKLSTPQKYAAKISVKSASKPKWIRVQDRAGNYSKWKALR